MVDLSTLGYVVSGIAGENNVAIKDVSGRSGIYVRHEPTTLDKLLTNGDSSIVHPAFIVNGEQVDHIYIGKYQGSLRDGRIYSMPGVDPVGNINLDNFSAACRNKGAGHHCITAAEWAYLALRAKKNGTQPKGNNVYGKDVSENEYIAISSMERDDQGRIQHTASGTGPISWSDTGNISGVFDLNGNVWEGVIGIRLVHGELQVIPYNDAATSTTDLSATSSAWWAINAQATGWDDLFLVSDGTGTTENSVKLDYVSSHWQWQAAAITSSSDSSRNGVFGSTTTAGDISNFATLYLRAMALIPDTNTTAAGYFDDYFYANNGAAERYALRGSANGGTRAGVFAIYFSGGRTNAGISIGGRPAYYE